jgi:Fic family protein
MFLFQYGISAEGKPFKDYLGAKNHAEAIDFLYDIVKNERDISTGVLKEINALLLSGVKYTKAIDSEGKPAEKPANPGEYKKLPNHVLQPDGTIHYCVEPLHVASEMDMLFSCINENLHELHPVIFSAVSHLNMVRIHPFDGGNGRGARILMNIILIRKGFPPAIVRNEQPR